MSKTIETTAVLCNPNLNEKSFVKRFLEQKYLMLLVIPPLVWVIIFCYIPLYGILIAFQEYDIVRGFFHSQWVGLANFRELFNDSFFITAMRNTVIISFLKLITGFPVPIIFAVLLNEINNVHFKKIVQTASYLPHFLSWVFIVGFLGTFLGTKGSMNLLLQRIGLIDDPILFLGEKGWFLATVVLSDVWKEFGFSSIIYIATIVSIPIELYESAIIDGANRFQKIRYITLPSIRGTVVILLIMQISRMLTQNFDQLFLMTNSLTRNVGQIIETYGFTMGINMGRFSYATAIGLFVSVVSVILLTMANYVSRKLTDNSLF